MVATGKNGERYAAHKNGEPYTRGG
jgi:hypothetical protein